MKLSEIELPLSSSQALRDRAAERGRDGRREFAGPDAHGAERGAANAGRRLSESRSDSTFDPRCARHGPKSELPSGHLRREARVIEPTEAAEPRREAVLPEERPTQGLRERTGTQRLLSQGYHRSAVHGDPERRRDRIPQGHTTLREADRLEDAR